MIVRVEQVAYGRQASKALAAAIAAAKGDAPLAPVTVVVPSNFVGLGARRLLGSGELGVHGVANVSFLTPLRLAQLLAADQLLDTRPLTNPVLGAAVRLALASDPGPFAAVAEHHATEAALAGLYTELSTTTAENRRRIAGHGPTARTAVALFDGIAARLTGFHDEATVAQAAADHPRLGLASEPLGTVIWYLPAPLNQPLTRLMSIVLTVRASTVVVALTGDADADEAVRRTCRLAGVSLGATGAATPSPVTADRVVSVTDADEEVRSVVRAVVELVECGVALDRIGVFYPVPDPYVSILEQQLEAAAIPANGPSRARLADSVAGRTLLAALNLPAQQWRRDRVLALVSGGPVRHGGDLARPAAWEQTSRRAGVVAGLDDWSAKLTAAAAADRAAAAVEGTTARRSRVLEDAATDADALRSFVADLASAVGQVRAATAWRERSERAKALLRRILGSSTPWWPEAELDARDRVDAALDRLAELDELEPAGGFDVFMRALRSELEVARGRNGRFGHGVLYGPLGGAVGLDLEAVFVLGCAEGLCPSPRREDSLLSDAARELSGGDLEPRAGRLHDQHRAFLAALAAAPAGRRTLLFPRGDLRSGREAQPSRWLLATATALAGEPVLATDFGRLPDDVVHVVPSFAAGLLGTASFADVTERDLGVVSGIGAGADVLGHPLASLAGRGLEALRSRSSASFTAWDGNVAGHTVPFDGEQLLSPTRLELWSRCGFRYFLRYVLGLADRDDPERVIELSSLDRGSLLHEVLERFLVEVLERGAPAPGDRWNDEDRARARALTEEVCDDFERRGRTGRPLLWRSTRAELLRSVEDFLTADDEYRSRSGVRPQMAEWAFGREPGAAHPPLRLTLPSGRLLSLHGRVDRVDLAEDGSAVVSDYKTNKQDDFKDVEGEDPFLAGKSLQLGVYAEAATQHLGPSAKAQYWMVRVKDATVRRGFDWGPQHRQRFLELLDVIADGIEGGIFPAVPGEYNTFFANHDVCRYCPFDSVCPGDRGETAEVKLADPVLSVRRRLQTEVAP